MCVTTLKATINISYVGILILQSTEHKASEIPQQVTCMVKWEPVSSPMEISDGNLERKGAGEEPGPQALPWGLDEGEKTPDSGGGSQFSCLLHKRTAPCLDNIELLPAFPPSHLPEASDNLPSQGNEQDVCLQQYHLQLWINQISEVELRCYRLLWGAQIYLIELKEF